MYRATALFAFPLKPDVQPSEIFYFDFRKPILGFSVVEDGGAVVYLDVEWTDSEVEDMLQDKVKNVRVVRISSGDKVMVFSIYELFSDLLFVKVYRICRIQEGVDRVS